MAEPKGGKKEKNYSKVSDFCMHKTNTQISGPFNIKHHTNVLLRC